MACAQQVLNKLRHMQAEVFEEIATMDFPFEGIPTIPPRKDMDHMVVCNIQNLTAPNAASVVTLLELTLAHICFFLIFECCASVWVMPCHACTLCCPLCGCAVQQAICEVDHPDWLRRYSSVRAADIE